jgi:sec-independent protein translocase protein TatB
MNGFFGIGFMELAFIAILALIVLGPERLPGAARETAKFLGQLRAISSEFTSQFSEELQVLDELNPKKLADEFVQEAMKPTSKQGTNKTKKTPTKPKPAANTQPLADKHSASPPAKTKSEASAEVDSEANLEGKPANKTTNGLDAPDENQILPPAEVEPGDASVNGDDATSGHTQGDISASADIDGTDPDGASPDSADPDSAEKPA